MSNVSIAGYAGWPIYDTFHIVSLSGWPVYDPNPLRSNPNPKKPVSGSCRVRGLGQTLTPMIISTTFSKQIISSKLLRVVISGKKSNFIGKFKLEPITIYCLWFVMKMLWKIL